MCIDNVFYQVLYFPFSFHSIRVSKVMKRYQLKINLSPLHQPQTFLKLQRMSIQNLVNRVMARVTMLLSFLQLLLWLCLLLLHSCFFFFGHEEDLANFQHKNKFDKVLKLVMQDTVHITLNV